MRVKDALPDKGASFAGAARAKTRDNDTLIDLTKTLQEQLGEEKAKSQNLGETLQALRELLEPITQSVVSVNSEGI